EAVGPDGASPLGDRAALPGLQDRAGARSLRRTEVSGLAAPHGDQRRRLCVRADRADAAAKGTAADLSAGPGPRTGNLYAAARCQPPPIHAVDEASRTAVSSTADLSGGEMARTGLRMMPTSPSPSLKFRTAGFPQYGFKASLSGATCRPAPRGTENASSPPGPARAPRLSSPFARLTPPKKTRLCVLVGQGLPRAAVREAHLSTPGVLGSGTSSVVSRPPRLLRPHPPVPRARGNFTAWPVICRAFAVRERLGDPRDLPYFRCRAVQTSRRPYAGVSQLPSRCSCAPRCQASSLCPRVATHKSPPLPAISGGEYFTTRHRSLHAAARLLAKTS